MISPHIDLIIATLPVPADLEDLVGGDR